ncbi:MAG: hypothetical protein R3F18_15460 [Lysobacterales bacterium]|nr:hypothetical protein [Xanthomonadales bacterium]
MYGFTTTLTDISFDPQIMVGLVGDPAVKAVADAAEQSLRRVCSSLGTVSHLT